MQLKNVVIGANGYIGRYLTKALLDVGQDVVCISSGDNSGISLSTGLFPTDFSLPKNVDTVYYLAQSPRYRQTPEQSSHLLSVNCIAAVQAAEAARQAGVRRFIYASTGNVYQHSFLPLDESAPVNRQDWYALSKVMAEDALALYRPYLDITIARIFGVYGPKQTDKLVSILAGKIIKGEEIFLDRNPTDLDDLDGLVVSLMYIDDLVEGLILLKDATACDYINLAGEEAVSIRKLSIELANTMGVTPKISVRENYRMFNLISDNSMQLKSLFLPKVLLSDGINRLFS